MAWDGSSANGCVRMGGIRSFQMEGVCTVERLRWWNDTTNTKRVDSINKKVWDKGKGE